MRLYPLIGATPRIGSLEWIWPRGGKIKMAHLEHEQSKNNWQGSELPLICCQEDERVRMADGSLKAVRNIRPGDYVATLQGPRPVLWTGNRRLEKCVRATVRDGNGAIVGRQVHSLTHKVLTTEGWVSYVDMCGEPHLLSTSASTECRCAHKSAVHSCKKRRFLARLRDSLFGHRRRPQGSSGSLRDRQCEPVIGACTAQQVRKTGCGAYQCKHQAPLQPSSVSQFGVVLHARWLPSGAPVCACHASVTGEGAYAQSASSLPGLMECCSSSLHPCGEPAHLESGSVRVSSPSPVGVAGRSRTDLPSDDLGTVQRHTLRKLRYAHPYRGEERTAAEETTLGSCEIEPCDEHWVIDLTVGGESHYITECGLANKNCFDELTHFSESQFWYLVSRNRSTSGVKGYVRATCNPDADSWVSKFIEWWIDQETGFPIKERDGKLRWVIRINDALHWSSNRQELIGRFRGKVPDAALMPKSVTFISAKLTDNKALMTADPGYLANLLSLPTVERERLLGGNWRIRPAAGLYFQRRWLKAIHPDMIPSGAVWVRGWDLAGTPKTDTNNPDFTESVLIGKTFDGRYIVADHTYMRGSPAEVEAELLRVAKQDRASGNHVTHSIPQDPAQAGKAQAAALIKLLDGYTVRASVESRAATATATGPSAKAAKVGRFGPFSAQAEAGNVLYVEGPWNSEFFDRLEAFPAAAKDDTADATSRAHSMLGENTYDMSMMWVGELDQVM